MFSQKSHNRKILANLLRKTRKNDTSNLNYFILYGFLYKYLSDRLKDHLMRNIAGDEGYLKTFYQTPEGIQDLRHIALSDLGYFIEGPSAYMDNHITDSIVEDIFSPRFFRLLNDNITFSDENRAKHYFDEIIGILSKQMDLYSLNINDEMNSFMNNYLFSLSKLDVFENDFTYAQAYDAIAYSIFGRLMSTPDYITDIISKIVFSQRKSRGNAYDPFLKDASILFNLKREGVAIDIYGKEKDELLYFYSIIKAFINELDFDEVFLCNENSIDSMAVDGKSFDMIVSKVPSRFRNISKERLKRQSLEIPAEDSDADFKRKLLSNLDMDRLGDDKQVIEALKIIENKYKQIEKEDAVSFSGEYESLKDSEFLFLINMINSLKDDGMMVVSLSQNFLFKNSLTLLRKFLTYENNYIDAVISLPEGMDRVIRPEVIIVFKKKRIHDDIVFIDLSNNYGTMPSPNAVSGLMRRNLLLDDKTMGKVVEALNERRPFEKFSEIVPLRELAKNDFNLAVSRYVDTYDGDFIRLKDLKGDREKIDSKMDELNGKINDLMNDLNINF